MILDPLTEGQGQAPSSIRLRVLPLLAGAQSTTLTPLAASGEIGPKPDCAIFTDTGRESKLALRSPRSPEVTQCCAVPGPHRLGREHSRQTDRHGCWPALGIAPGFCKA